LRDNASTNLADDENPVAGYGKLILAIVAAGKNPRSFGGIDYVDKLTDEYDDTQVGYSDWLNDDFWGLIALSAIGESDSIQNSKTFIINNQNSDGGWGYDVDIESDADNTAAAISALIAAGESASSQTTLNPSSRPMVDSPIWVPPTRRQLPGRLTPLPMWDKVPLAMSGREAVKPQ
jgi:hypothetical protein